MAERRSPSPARLRRALAEGDTPLSPFSVRAAGLAIAALLVPALARAVASRFDVALRVALASPEKSAPTSLATDVLGLVAPLVVASTAAALVVGLAGTRFALVPRKRAPLHARFFGPGRLVEAARTLVFAAVAVAIAGYALPFALRQMAPHIGQSAALLADSGNVPGRIASTIAAFAVLLAASDIALRHSAWLGRLAQTPEEARRERRETEGAPELRRERRRAHEALARDDEL